MSQTRPIREDPAFPCPLNQSQKGVYLECISDPSSLRYNIPFLTRIPDGADLPRFCAAVRKVVDLHDIFHVNIVAPDGVPSMILRDHEIGFSETACADPHEALRDFTRPFDLENDFLCRFSLAHTDDGVYFLADVHHIIFDGSSVGVFFSQIADAYEGRDLTGEDMTLFDAARAETLPPDPEKWQTYEVYFRERLEGMDCDSRLLSDRIVEDVPHGLDSVHLSSEGAFSCEEAVAFAKGNRISENALLLGAFAYTLARFNGTDRCFFSTVHTGRLDRRLSRTVGMFVRTLPMACAIDEAQSPVDFLRNIYNDYYFLKKNDVLPFGEVAARYGVNNGVSFVYQSELLSGTTLEGKPLEPHLTQTGDSICDFSLMVLRENGSYHLSGEFDRGLYSRELIGSFLHMYRNVVRGMLTAKTLGEITLTDDVTAAALDAFNRTEAPYRADKTPVDLFREQAKATPDHVCVVYDGRRYTYRETDELSDRLAAHLVRKGVGRETVTGILIPRCEHMAICALGVLKAGGAYMPLDPTYPPERLNLMMEDSGASYLITTPELTGVIDESFTGERMMTEEISSLPPCGIALPAPSPKDLFVLLYTSGSTGKPKGVMFEHGNALVTIEWVKKYFRMDDASKVTLYASYGFDAHVFDQYSALTSGAELHIISDEIRLDFPALKAYYNENGITHTVMTTQVGRQFALMGGLTTLKHLGVAGEKLTPLDPPEGPAFYNLYGPTEGSVVTSVFRMERRYKDVPIGKPVDNLKLYVTDKLGRRLPFCAAGELWISGPHVTRGYLNRPEKTAEAYGENPFCNETGYERVYRTGDIVRLLPDGNLQFVGRRDGQVKVRGFRVELTEIEEVVRAFEGVKDATVAAFDDPAGGKFVAAYVVSDSAISPEALSDFIRQRKPPYMVPAVIMQLDKIPLNQNQKVNRRALPVPQRKVGEIVPPETEMQKKILAIAAEIMGYDAFGVTTSLYEAGLTSIGALRLNVALADAFGVPMKIADIRANDTVRKLEAFLASAVPAASYALQDDYPITQTQNGIFVESMAAPGTTVYNIPVLLRLDAGVDLTRLQKAVAAAIDAHPYVKCALFTDAGGNVRAKRRDADAPEVLLLKRDALPRSADLVRPYRLLGERLYRAELYETCEGKFLFLDFHHIISDGASEAVLLSDIQRAYAGETLTAETYSGYEAALEEESVRSGSRLAEAKAYWKELLASCDADCLPKKEPEAKSGAGSVREIADLDVSRVDAFCIKHNLTLNAFFNAAFAFVLSRFTGKDSVSYATIHNGRSDSRFSRCVTMLVKTMPMVADLVGETGVVPFVRTLQKQLTEGMAQDACSFAELAADYGVRSDVIFAYQGDEMSPESFCGAPAELITLPSDAAKAPVSLNVYRRDGKFVSVVEYRRDTFSRAFALALADALAAAAGSFLTSECLKDVTMLSPRAGEAYRRMNDTAFPLEDVTAVQLFERAAAAHPDRPCMISDGRELSWNECNAQANRIAHALIRFGVQADDIVGMVLDRSCELPMTEIAILKSGGAFLPALPDYPDERIEYCLTDAGCPCVITTEVLRAQRQELFGDSKPYKTFTLEELLRETDASDPNLPLRMDQLAYCIYTSGSTGKPKGVMLEHRNLTNLAQTFRASQAFYREDGEGSALAECSVSFDASVMEIYVPLCAGKTLCMTTDEEFHNPLALRDLMLKNNVRALVGTPSFLTNLATMPEMRDAYANMRSIMVGAEVFPKALYEALRKCSATVQIINGYGPTECTVCCSSKDLTDGDDITIGGPTGNVQLYVMDKCGHILPPYGAGELVISGAGVGRGYVKLPEKTAASFITLNGRRAYRSGDFVRLNGKGEIDFTGRIDNQVKLRGFRVELDEIEKVLCEFGPVQQSKVIVRGSGAEEFLAGYFTADSKVDPDELTAHLKSRLTYYMVPQVLMQLDQMPLTPNGKIDKKALPEVVRTIRRAASRRAAKKSLEQRLCEVFASVLNAEEVYADDNFFELGGTSITASKVTMVLMSENISVQYGDIFDHPTPESLSEFLEARDGKAAPAAPAPEAAKSENTPAALRFNIVRHAPEVKREPLGNVLLTGATGFLGIHILKELLEIETGHIYCLVRKGSHESPLVRLKAMLIYYFSDGFADALRDRITVLDADITDDTLAETLADVPFDTVINCAACVKHFSDSDILERINVHGVENLIAVCKARGAKLIQISTVSVPGIHTKESYENQVRMHENELFVIDDMQNKYGISKYHAELKMLTAIDEGLRGKIIRVGNLMGRHSDGEFQVNLETNMFLSGIRGFATMGKYPISHMTDPMRFSPVDCTARAVVLLAGTNDQFTAFNCDNRYGFDEMKIIDSCNRCGIPIAAAPDEEYYAEYRKKLGDDKVNAKLNGLAAYDIQDAHAVETDNLFTTNILYRIGFSWPLVDDAYLDRAITSILTLDYFDLDGEEEDS